MAHLPSGLVSHSRKVCNLYKRVIRHIESVYVHLDETRYQVVLMRAEFDKAKDVKDLRVAKKLLENAEKELAKNEHWSYKKFPESPGGTAFEREHPLPDWMLDYWEPMEKARYPKYFALREKRKLEYEKFYEQEYGQKPPQC